MKRKAYRDFLEPSSVPTTATRIPKLNLLCMDLAVCERSSGARRSASGTGRPPCTMAHGAVSSLRVSFVGTTYQSYCTVQSWPTLVLLPLRPRAVLARVDNYSFRGPTGWATPRRTRPRRTRDTNSWLRPFSRAPCTVISSTVSLLQ